MRAVDSRDLDDAIDRAVRSLMNAEPRGDFRRRVLARLHEPLRGWLTAPRLAAAGLCAVAVVAFMMFDRAPDRPTGPSVPLSQQARTPSSPEAPRTIDPAPAAAAVSASPVPPNRAGAADRRRPAESRPVYAAAILESDDDAGIAPLEAVEPLGIAAIAQAPLVSRELTVGQLRVEPIAIQPLPQGGTDLSTGKER